MFFCNQKNQKFRGSDPRTQRPRRGVYLTGVIFFKFASVVFSTSLPLRQRNVSINLLSDISKFCPPQRKMMRTEFCRSASLFQNPKFVRITKNQLIFSTKLRFLKIYCRLPRNCKYHFPLLTSNFRRAGDWVSPLSRRYKDRKFEKTKPSSLLR